MKDWIQDEHKPYLWNHIDYDVSVICYTNDDDPDIKCIWVRMLHNGDYVSNYFPYSFEGQGLKPLDFALKMVNDFLEKNEEEEKKDE